MKLAPVALFAYNRPKHLARTLRYLADNVLAKETVLYVFCDGAKKNASAEALAPIADTRAVLQQSDWNTKFAKVIVIQQEINIGLANSIIQGVTQVVNQHGNIIVLEDDLITSPHFLSFMNDALKLYEKESKVLSIGACNFFAKPDGNATTFFTSIPDCWGWATWQNRWQLFNADGAFLHAALKAKNLMSTFNLEGAYPFERMLQQTIAGKVSSWAVRWYAVSLLHDKINLYPTHSLTNHIAGEGATHANQNVTPPLAKEPIQFVPIEPKMLPKVYHQMRRTYWWQQSIFHKLSIYLQLKMGYLTFKDED
jgi:GR25 family glycosyltransferase involved in LPS biosynthesis